MTGTLVERIWAVLGDRPDARTVRMFGGISFMVNEKLVVAARAGEALLVRVDPARGRTLEKRAGVSRAKMGTGRSMGAGWLQVEPRVLDREALEFWIAEALAYTGADAAVDSKAKRGTGRRQGTELDLPADIVAFHEAQTQEDRAICEVLAREFSTALPEAERKVWHRHPVWFLDQNPIVGYHRLKAGMRMLFWSGQSFEEPGLTPEGSFKAATVRYESVDDIDLRELRRWLGKARTIQWDYAGVVKRKGKLIRRV